MKTANILGEEYKISFDDSGYCDESRLAGFCDYLKKEIKLNETEIKKCDAPNIYQKEIERHEIIHAFLNESGLRYSSIDGWAVNEEMVDWIALQLPKIFKAMKEVDAI